MEEARARFAATCALAAAGADGFDGDKVWAAVLKAYTAPERHFHNLDHVLKVLSFVDRAVAGGAAPSDRAPVELAVWLADLDWDARRTRVSRTTSTAGAAAAAGPGNEALSADAARVLLESAGLSPDAASKVAHFIADTAHAHHVPGEPDTELLVDAQLSTLAAHWPDYVAGAAALRREHGHLSDDAYCAQRARALKSLLDREQLFTTQAGQALCEVGARGNMREEWKLAFAGRLLDATPLAEEAEGDESADA